MGNARRFPRARNEEGAVNFPLLAPPLSSPEADTAKLLSELIREVKGLRNDIKMRDLRDGKMPMSIQFLLKEQSRD